MSQRRLARLCHVSSGYMTQLLRGDRYPGPAVRERILGALPGIGFDEVFEEVT
jgi:transcriptional regulator with XRE-family HTH domain